MNFGQCLLNVAEKCCPFGAKYYLGDIMPKRNMPIKSRKTLVLVLLLSIQLLAGLGIYGLVEGIEYLNTFSPLVALALLAIVNPLWLDELKSMLWNWKD